MVHVLNNIWRAAEVEKGLQRKAQPGNNKGNVMSKNYHIAVLPGDGNWSGSDDPGAESAGCRAQPLCDAHLPAITMLGGAAH